jgi:hypothetical protein
MSIQKEINRLAVISRSKIIKCPENDSGDVELTCHCGHSGKISVAVFRAKKMNWCKVCVSMLPKKLLSLRATSKFNILKLDASGRVKYRCSSNHNSMGVFDELPAECQMCVLDKCKKENKIYTPLVAVNKEADAVEAFLKTSTGSATADELADLVEVMSASKSTVNTMNREDNLIHVSDDETDDDILDTDEVEIVEEIDEEAELAELAAMDDLEGEL